MNAYIAFGRNAFKTQLAYPTEIWSGIFGHVVQVLARIAIWTAAFGSAHSVNDITLQEMITFALLSGALQTAWPQSQLIYEVSRLLTTGDISVYLLQPTIFPLAIFFSECGRLFCRLSMIVVPTVTIIGAIYGADLTASAAHALWFLLFWLLSFLIVFLFGLLAGLVSFWLMTPFSLDWLLAALLTLLSGSFVPFWFYPEPWGEIARYSPFAWVGYYPTAVYIGKISAEMCPVYFGIGVIWFTMLALCSHALWAKTSSRLTINGG